MVMGDQGPLCGLPWPVCPDDLGQCLSSSGGTAWCLDYGRRWLLNGVQPALVRPSRLWDQEGSEQLLAVVHLRARSVDSTTSLAGLGPAPDVPVHAAGPRSGVA